MVGMSPWVVHGDEDLYGKDAGVWRPERWLDSDGNKRRRMEAGLLTGSAHLVTLTREKPFFLYLSFPCIELRETLPSTFIFCHNPETVR